jgi:hypothetical protein
MGTRGQWANDFLKALGNTSPNLKTTNLVAAWTKGEGTEARYNPLATTLDYGQNTKFNNCCGGNGVKNFPSRDAGIQASVRTLSGSFPGYSDIVKGLRTNEPELALKGMKRNVWGTNFVYVESVWRSSDVRGESLKSEDLSIPERIYGAKADDKPTPVHPPEVIRPGDYNNGGSGINPMGPDGSTTAPGGYDGIDGSIPSEGVTEQGVRSFFKIYFVGIPFVGISIGLFVYAAAKSDAGKTALKVASKGVL